LDKRYDDQYFIYIKRNIKIGIRVSNIFFAGAKHEESTFSCGRHFQPYGRVMHELFALYSASCIRRR
jgi:hypothetical protein